MNEYDFATEYDEILDQEEETQQGFHIMDDSVADWAVRKVNEERAENKRLHDIADEQIARIMEKVELADKRLESRTAFLLGRLSEYFGKVPHKATKTQEKYQLLSGSLILTKEKVTMEKDDEALLEFLKSTGNKEYIKTEEKPAWGEYKKILAVIDGNVVDTVTGAVVEGVKTSTKPATFDVK